MHSARIPSQIFNPISENKLTTSDKWKLLFSTFINANANTLDLEVVVDDNTIQLTTKDPHVVEQLKSVLNSPEALRASLSYTINEVAGNQSLASRPQAVAKIFYPPVIKLEHGIGETVYEKLFGEAALRKLGRIAWVNEANGDRSYVLQGECSDELTEFTNSQITMYRNLIGSATYEELRHALSSDPAHYKPLPLRNTKDGILAKHVDKIIHKTNDGKGIRFDFGLIMTGATEPNLNITNPASQPNEAPSFKISIDRMHLTNYLSLVVFKEGFVLKINNGKATPILLSVKRDEPLKQIVSLNLDCSESMRDVRQDYLAHVVQFLKKLAELNDYKDADIRINSFNDTVLFKGFKLINMQEIISYLATLKMEGMTHINASLNAELNALLKQKRTNENVTMIVFTDGNDTSNNPLHGQQLSDTMKNINQMQGSRPRIYGMTLGSVSRDKLDNLSRITGGEMIPLKTINDFRQIFTHLAEMSHVKEFVTFVQNEVAFVAPSSDHDLSVASNTLQVPGSFSVGNVQYHVENGGVRPANNQSESASSLNIENLLSKISDVDKVAIFEFLQSQVSALPPAPVVAPRRVGLFSGDVPGAGQSEVVDRVNRVN